MKKTRLLLTTMALALVSTFQAQAQCDSVNYQADACNDDFNYVTASIETDRSVLLGDVYYMHSQASGHPWGQTTNPVAMDAVFGAGNWTQELFETADAAALFSAATSLIYMDGSDGSTNEMNTFIADNQAEMEAWVNNGGFLFVNAATNEGIGSPVGFVDISIPDTANTSDVTAVDVSHPAFVGPLATGTAFSGTDYAHNSVTGSGLTSILIATGGTDIILAEGLFGEGYLLVGGMTTPNYHSPAPDAVNFRTNLLFMMATFPEITTCHEDETVSVIEGETYTLPDYVADGDVIVENASTTTQDPAPGTLIASGAGMLTVTFTAENGSIVTDECSFVLTVEEVLGVNETAINAFSIFPNPASTSFQVKGDFTVANVAVYNVLGQKVMETLTNTVNVSSLNTGLYLVTVTDTEGNKATKRCIKK